MKKYISMLLPLIIAFLFAQPCLAATEYSQGEPAVSAGGSAYSSEGYEGTAYSADEGHLDKRVPGVGAFLGRLLDKLISFTGSSEAQIDQIFKNLPLILPDLYKVFITL